MYYKIKGFENYGIDRNGVVYNTDNGVIKSTYTNKSNGYLYVDLYKGNKAHKRPIHRLIAETFIPNPENKPTVDHINGNRTDNRIENLRWATYSEQNSRFNTVGVRSEKVLVIHESGKTMMFEKITDVANYFDCNISNISQMLKKGTFGKRGKTRGYKFEYIRQNKNV